MSTLLERLGGRDAIEIVVAGFYERVLGDERLRRFFRGTSMSRLQALQVDFFCAALGGTPHTYRGRDMRSAHAGLAISDGDFDAVATHLVTTLESAGVDGELIKQVVAAIAPLRADIVTQAR
jgi:hemoglobin